MVFIASAYDLFDFEFLNSPLTIHAMFVTDMYVNDVNIALLFPFPPLYIRSDSFFLSLHSDSDCTSIAKSLFHFPAIAFQAFLSYPHIHP